MHSGPASTTSPPKSTTRIAISNSNHKRRADIFKHPLLVEEPEPNPCPFPEGKADFLRGQWELCTGTLTLALSHS
jgi:hypothetical protein